MIDIVINKILIIIIIVLYTVQNPYSFSIAYDYILIIINTRRTCIQNKYIINK